MGESEGMLLKEALVELISEGMVGNLGINESSKCDELRNVESTCGDG